MLSLRFHLLAFLCVFPCFPLCVFPLFSKDLRGSAKRRTLVYFRGFPCFFQKSKGWGVRVSLRFESLAFVGGHISTQNTEISPHRPCVRCAAIRIARLAFTCLTFVPCGIAEWFARVDRVRWTLAIGDWRFCPSKSITCCDLLLPKLAKKTPKSITSYDVIEPLSTFGITWCDNF